MTTTTNAANLRQKSIFFLLQSRYIFLLRALTWLVKLRIYLQISNNLHKDRLCYRKFLFGQVDPFHRKTLISSAKSQVQISFAQLIQRTSLYKYTRNILLVSRTLVLLCKIVCKFYDV